MMRHVDSVAEFVHQIFDAAVFEYAAVLFHQRFVGIVNVVADSLDDVQDILKHPTVVVFVDRLLLGCRLDVLVFVLKFYRLQRTLHLSLCYFLIKLRRHTVMAKLQEKGKAVVRKTVAPAIVPQDMMHCQDLDDVEIWQVRDVNLAEILLVYTLSVTG